MHANEGAPTGWHGALPRSLLEDALVRKLLILSPTADALGKCDYRLPLTRGLAPSDTWTARLMLLCREMRLDAGFPTWECIHSREGPEGPELKEAEGRNQSSLATGSQKEQDSLNVPPAPSGLSGCPSEFSQAVPGPRDLGVHTQGTWPTVCDHRKE